MDAIKNEYDGPKKLVKKIKSEMFTLDYAYSEDASILDAGIKETIRGVKVSTLAIGIALHRVNQEGLYIDLGFKNFNRYVESLASETGMSKKTVYNWTYIGQAYITHRPELEKIGFSDDDAPTKLPFLPLALEYYPKREVFKNILSMSKHEFENWVRLPASENKVFKPVTIKGSQLYAGKTPIVTFSPAISPKDRRYYEGLLIEGATAIEQNEIVGIFRFYSPAEKLVFERIYNREIKKIRAKK